MGVCLAGQGVNVGNVVGKGAKLREKVTGHLSALAPSLELADRTNEISVLTLKGVSNSGERSVMPLDQFGLKVESVYMAYRSGTVYDQNLFGSGGKVSLARRKWACWFDVRPDGRSQ